MLAKKEKLQMRAIKQGRVDVIRQVLFKEECIDSENTENHNLFYRTNIERKVNLVKYLLGFETDANEENTHDETPLEFDFERLGTTLSKKRIQLFKSMIVADADIRKKGVHKETALHLAAETGDIDFVSPLITRGADVNAKDELGRTPLHYAASNVLTEDPTLFEILLEAGASLNAKSVAGKTPLHAIAKSSPESPSVSLFKIIEVFKKHGADFDVEDLWKNAPVDLAITSSNIEAIKAFIFVGGVNPNHTYKSTPGNESLLHIVSSSGLLEILKFLLKNGAYIDFTDCDNETPLHRTIGAANEKFSTNEDPTDVMQCLQYLLEWNPDVNTITVDGRNILMLHDVHQDFPEELWKIILQHLAKIHSVDHSKLSLNLLNTIFRNSKYNCYFESCKLELWLAKNSTVSTFNFVTLFNLLVEDKKSLFRYARSLELVKYFTSENSVSKKFPIYGPTIIDRCRKAIEKRKKWIASM